MKRDPPATGVFAPGEDVTATSLIQPIQLAQDLLFHLV